MFNKIPKPNKRKRLIHNAHAVKKMKTNSSEPLLLVESPVRLIERENNVIYFIKHFLQKEKIFEGKKDQKFYNKIA